MADSGAAPAETKVEEAPPAEGGAGGEGAPAEGGATKKRKHWLPLESNPDVMNPYLEKLGWPTVMYHTVEVLSLEDWALDMVPKPVVGVMMLFPIKEASEKHRAEEAARIETEGQEIPAETYYTKQTVGNACGTVGLLHCAANATTICGSDLVTLNEESWLHNFLTRTKDMTPDERAAALEEDDALDEAHAEGAQGGQTRVPDLEERVNAHFVAFTNVKGNLLELDGRKKFPINHGPTTPETLLQDAAKVVRGFMDRDPGELRFTFCALAANTE
mmetsp:Transcript_17536/g.41040  ORF Transcript_17536/g.41040 Transcript_17536/m.41040 type:complete len:274 (-) Transcript_17536:24-845(-)